MEKQELNFDNAMNDFEDQQAQSINQQISLGAANVSGKVKARTKRMLERGAMQESLDKFAGINEEEILTFVPERRDLAGLGPIFLGLLVLLLLPGFAKLVCIPFLIIGFIWLMAGYVMQSKVDVPDGYDGVVCRFGSPIEGKAGRAAKGRSWYFNYSRFVPFLVSSRDQVVQLQNGTFTGDFGSIALSNQLVFRIVDPALFVSNTSPAGIMKILNLYASYITLRMITSMPDARVKFTGRDRIDNVVQSLNAYLSDAYGIQVIRATMPKAENDIIDDLEKIRTELKTIDAMSEDKQVRLESAIKEVESRMRKARKETRSKALELQHAKISMETSIAEEVNTQRQVLLIDARKELEAQVSQLKREIASVRAKLEKAKAIQQSFHGLEAQVELRKAGLKRKLFQQMIPRRVNVMGIEGIGSGVGLSLGHRLFRATEEASENGSS